ncbi:hypothetical protein [Streptomyces zagrosensis]|uniref:Uncharacterized protein n=1 Tax=Streptomyces zagrosensis TaxID=1042984 RepID=A0A7W9QEV2_9ACTN|nr:hypothetical protein [Streptomyces zagrosensis]MBB5938674.1 hypothetical protein [Streptomyces zagrosensis]
MSINPDRAPQQASLPRSLTQNEMHPRQAAEGKVKTAPCLLQRVDVRDVVAPKTANALEAFFDTSREMT